MKVSYYGVRQLALKMGKDGRGRDHRGARLLEVGGVGINNGLQLGEGGTFVWCQSLTRDGRAPFDIERYPGHGHVEGKVGSKNRYSKRGGRLWG